MQAYFVGWPNNTWSVLVTRNTMTMEELTRIGSDIDATADPGLATIWKVKFELGDFYCDMPSHQKPSGAPAMPFMHSGHLECVQLRPPYGALVSEMDATNSRRIADES